MTTDAPTTATAATTDAATATDSAATETTTTTPEQGDQNTAPEGAGQGEDATAAASTDTSDDAATGDEPVEHEEFTIEPPEEFAEFGDQFKAFASDMDGWLKDNPNATAREALQEAAMRQARDVSGAMQQQQQQVETWGEQAKKDPEIGGEKFDQNVATAVKAIDAYGSPEFKALLNDSGLGSHPEVIRFAVKAGRALEEPGVVTSATSQKPRSSVFKDLGYE